MSYDALLNHVIEHEKNLNADVHSHPLFRAVLGALHRARTGEGHTGREYEPHYVCAASDAEDAGGLSHLTLSAYITRFRDSFRITEVRDLSAGGIIINSGITNSIIRAEQYLATIGEDSVSETQVIRILSECLGKTVKALAPEYILDALERASTAASSSYGGIPLSVHLALKRPLSVGRWTELPDSVKDAVANLWIRTGAEDSLSFWCDREGVPKWRLRELLLRGLEGELSK